MKLRVIFSYVVALPLLWGCARHLEPQEGAGAQVRMTAQVEGSDTTKIDISQGDGCLHLSWGPTDKLRVVGNTSEVYTIDEGFAAHKATFTGNSVEGSEFTVFYPGSYADEEALLARSYLNQVQKGNGSTAHLEYNAIARNLSDYRTVNFSMEEPGVMMSGAMKLVVKLPDGVTAVSSISIKASSNVFFCTNADTERTNTLTLMLEDCDVSESDRILTAYMMTSWQPLTLMKESKLTVRVTLRDIPCYFENVITFNKTVSHLGGSCFVIDMSSREMKHQMSGSGTEADPYLICDPDDLRLVSSLSKSGQTTYYTMCADVDMKGQTFTPAFTQEGHSCAIDFAGGGFTIRNISVEADQLPSIFGELNGRVSDLVIENPVIKGNGGDCAVVCGRLGSTSSSGSLKNIRIVNPIVTATLDNGENGAGVLAGDAVSGTIEGITIKYGSIAVSGSSSTASVGGMVGSSESVGVVNSTVDTLSVTNSLGNTGTSYSDATATGGVIGRIRGTASIALCSFVGGQVIAPSELANYAGGILGIGTVASTVSRCRAEFDLTAGTNIGGIVGYLKAGSVYQCFYKGNLSGVRNTGGIVGYLGERSSVADCCTAGSFSVSSQVLGGIAGEVLRYSTVTSCYSTAELTGGRVVGGIVGRLANAGWTAAGTNHANEVRYCLAWNSSLSATGTTSQGGSGALAGFTGTKNSFDYCYRKADFSFSCTACPDGVEPLVNQDRTTSDITTGISSPYWYPYHAHDVDAGTYPDVTSVVKYINGQRVGAWDTDVWNLEGAYPVLYGVGGSLPDPPSPEPGVDPGSDWTRHDVADGIIYWSFHNVDAITGKMQCVHVTSVDMNSGKWALKLYYDGSRHINSDVLASTGAYVSMNAGYERESIVVKKDGTLHYNIVNDFIAGTSVPNWKNEGSICFDDGLLADINVNAAGYEWDLEQQRKTYAAMPQKNIISSAPVLILDFEQLGTSFCNRYSGSEWGSESECPTTHQGSMYPRTSIGYTRDGYLLLVVNDGRFSSQAVGMSCAQLTRFIAKYFNPECLLNLDGGGSSTMCVKGFGDSSTHVVNHPSDHNTWDHADERDVPTHFYIIPAE